MCLGVILMLAVWVTGTNSLAKRSALKSVQHLSSLPQPRSTAPTRIAFTAPTKKFTESSRTRVLLPSSPTGSVQPLMPMKFANLFTTTRLCATTHAVLLRRYSSKFWIKALQASGLEKVSALRKQTQPIWPECWLPQASLTSINLAR